MLAHVSIAVNDFELSKKFYDETLSVLGYQRVYDFFDSNTNIFWAGYGTKDEPLVQTYPNLTIVI